MNISNRIKKIIEVLPKSELLADVGCDHGYVGVYALLSNKAKKVLFVDISLPSLKKAKLFASKFGLEDKCEFVCGDGLCGRKVDCAVLAGMGGKEITKILSEATFLPKKLVLNPMKGIEETRKYLQNGYTFLYDEIFFDKKFYSMMSLERGGQNLSAEEIKYGKTNLEYFCEDFCRYLLVEIQKCDIILNRANCESVRLRKVELEKLLEKGKIC